jgi:hypothetical protein
MAAAKKTLNTGNVQHVDVVLEPHPVPPKHSLDLFRAFIANKSMSFVLSPCTVYFTSRLFLRDDFLVVSSKNPAPALLLTDDSGTPLLQKEPILTLCEVTTSLCLNLTSCFL